MKIHIKKDIFNNILNTIRRLHIHLGLFLIMFIWLFFVSGLILNHGSWKFARFYENRKENNKVFVISNALFRDDNEMIRLIEAKLKIVGEVSQFKKDTAGFVNFSISSPGLINNISINSQTGYGTLKVTQYNFWGKLRTLHTFNGMDKNNPIIKPNWIITKLWRIMMDITAVILIILSLGSWVMWFNVRREYKLGYFFIIAGLVIAGYFTFIVDLF